MYDQARFETLCRALNKVLKRQGDERVELTLEAPEADELVAALTYYREIVDPHSGDVLIGTEYTCPACGHTAEFRAQSEQVTREADHEEIGVEVFRVYGIAQCAECLTQTELKQFTKVALDGFDETAWSNLYTSTYQEREAAKIL